MLSQSASGGGDVVEAVVAAAAAGGVSQLCRSPLPTLAALHVQLGDSDSGFFARHSDARRHLARAVHSVYPERRVPELLI